MTQENCPQLNNLIQGVEEVILNYQKQGGVTDEIAGREIRRRVGDILSACGEKLPPTLTIYRDPNFPDFRLNTRTGVLENAVAQRPRPLSDQAWGMLGIGIVRALRRATTLQTT